MTRSPSALTIQRLRDLGYMADVAERWIPGANIRKDLFGFGDIVAIGHGYVILVQATSIANIAARRTKIEGIEHAAPILRNGVHVEVWGWGKGKEPRLSRERAMELEGTISWLKL